MPTPRGGGLAIFASFLLCMVILSVLELVSVRLLFALCGGGSVIALVGLWDDRKNVDAKVRLLIQLVLSVIVVFTAGKMPDLFASENGYWLYIPFLVFFVLFFVWNINLYNFMDGINGIASVQSASVFLSGSLLMYILGMDLGIVVSSAVIGLSSLGFIFWNFPFAKIFMGDVGSGFLGYLISAFSFYSGIENPVSFWCWLVMSGAFTVDATITLIRRVLRGEKAFVAHRLHAYQYASRKFNSHTLVTLSVLFINLFWLLPVALFVANEIISGPVGVALAYMPLVYLAYTLKAGARELQEI